MSFESNIEFKLSAINWKTVGIMESGHLEADRIHHEELLRFAFHLTDRWGVAAFNEGDIEVTSEYDGGISLQLKRCYAITPKGYLISCKDSIELECSNDNAVAAIPIYLCIDNDVEEGYDSPEVEMYKGEAGFSRPLYRLTDEKSGDTNELDRIQIGQLKLKGTVFTWDEEFIPNCLTLNSHWKLKKRVDSIQLQAGNCLTELENQIKSNNDLLQGMATPLSLATIIQDWSISPYTYLERLIASLCAIRTLHYRIPDGSVQINVSVALYKAIYYAEVHCHRESMEWAEALQYIEIAFSKLKSAFPFHKQTIEPIRDSIFG